MNSIKETDFVAYIKGSGRIIAFAETKDETIRKAKTSANYDSRRVMVARYSAFAEVYGMRAARGMC